MKTDHHVVGKAVTPVLAEHPLHGCTGTAVAVCTMDELVSMGFLVPSYQPYCFGVAVIYRFKHGNLNVMHLNSDIMTCGGDPLNLQQTTCQRRLDAIMRRHNPDVRSGG